MYWQVTILFAGYKTYNHSIIIVHVLNFQFWKSNNFMIEPSTDSESYMYCFGRCFHYGKN